MALMDGGLLLPCNRDLGKVPGSSLSGPKVLEAPTLSSSIEAVPELHFIHDPNSNINMKTSQTLRESEIATWDIH